MKINKIYYTSKFQKNFSKLPLGIQNKTIKREKLFRADAFHPKLKTHKLKGPLQNFCSFSVDYRYRVVFAFERGNTATFIDIGTHPVYQ